MNDVCSGFESQNYLRDRCRKCFRQKDKHENTSTPVQSKKEKRKSLREKTSDNGGPEEDDGTDLLSLSSYQSATSKGMSSVKSCDSVNDAKSMATAVSGSACEDDRMLTPTEDDNSLIFTMKEEIRKLREDNIKLKEERELCSRNCLNKSKEMSEQSLVAMLEERLNEAESSIQDYRDENTVLKCELRDLQETTYANSDSKLRERITATEALCDELMEENENLKTEVRDLQQEIEEMQDQYREEEIEEFRELQRELEQNAKNCRILQFKLRKAERIKEQTDAEKLQLQSRINDLIGSSSEVDTESVRSDSIRVKELESELRIAKEVSVRLHTELEQSEEKRYKLEDELFYMKEKVRELQTQNKWRESRNKTDVAMKRLSTELTTFVPTSDGEVSKELRDALEREIDSREQLKFAEEDLKRTQQRLKEVENENEVLLKKLSKSARLRPPMVRSASEGNAHLQLELAEHEVEHLSTKIDRLERTNDHLLKKIIELEADCATRASINEACPIVGEFNLTHEMEKDMGKMIATISDLERKNHELNLHLKNYETKGINSATFTGVSDLRNEKEKRRLLEAEIVELKHTLLKTDNQKVIALATKIEQLNAQHAMINERCTNLHKKAIKNCDNESYMNELKSRLEMLEKENSELKATSIIKEIQGKGTGPEEMEQCCEVLASIESHTNRLCKQVEKIDQSQKDERRRSLSKDCSAAIIADLANLLAELKSVHKIMDNIKESIPMSVRHSPVLGQESPRETECAKCVENQKLIDEQQNEVIFYKKKNKDLTNQILQTEDRWTIEIEKQRQIFENEIKTLTCRITDYKIQFEEQSQLLQSETFNILEKTRALEEQEEKCKRLQHELEEQKKERQELEQNRKSVREFEIKYKKLESIFDQEREKMNSERTRSKNEVIALKKIAEEAEELLKSTSQDFKKKEALWRSDRDALEKELVSLKKQLLTCKSDEGSDHDDTATVTDSNPENPPSLNRRESDKIHIIDLKKQLALCEKKCTDYETMLEDMKIANADMLDQLNKTKQGWQKDKEAYQHKIRQTEKIRMVEMDALQQKFSSRMRIMEDTNKSLHSQLVLARRERDAHKDMLANFERKVQDEQNENNLREKRISESQEKISYLQKNITELETELERVHTDLRLTKEARKADQILWKVDRTRGRNEKLSENDLRKIEHLQTQFQDCEKFYSKEIERLKKKSKEMVEEFQQEKTVYNKMTTELREQVRVLEIELRNLGQKKDNQAAASEILEAEVTRLQQAIHLNELQKLTRKYRLSSIIDQLQLVTDPIRRGGRSERDGNPGGLKYITSQLIALRDEDAQASVTDEHYSSSQPSLDRNGYTPSMSECEGTYDNISQSSLSIRSVASMPVRGIISTESHGGSDPYARHLTERSNVDPSPVRSIDRKSFKNTKDAGCGTTGQTLTAGCPFQRASSYDRTSDAAVYTSNRYSKNISCHVRHEELTRGGQPSVRLMAQAFEANDNCVMEKQGFFGIRKSRSVETARDCTQKKVEPCDSCNLQYNSNQIKESDESPYATLPRGGRNPFRNMGSKLVERVRRSLSRSSRQSCPDVDESKNDERTSSKVEKSTTSLKKTKKRSAEAKARKNSGNQAMDTKN